MNVKLLLKYSSVNFNHTLVNFNKNVILQSYTYITYRTIKLDDMCAETLIYISQEHIALHGKIMKSITIFQNCQQSTTFSNATFSEKFWKLLQLHVTENGKRYLIYYITTYLL